MIDKITLIQYSYIALISLMIITIYVIIYKGFIYKPNKINLKTNSIVGKSVEKLTSTTKFDKYYRIVYLVFSLLGALAFSNTVGIAKLLLFVVIIALIPVEKLFGKRMPYSRIKSSFKDRIHKEVNLELYRCIVQLRNIALSNPESFTKGTDLIIEQISRFTKLTKPVFTQMLNMWYTGSEESAYQYFLSKIDTKHSLDFVGILSKISKLTPNELIEQLEMYIELVREDRITNLQKKQDLISNAMFIPMLIGAFIVLINFMFVVIWIDAMQMLDFGLFQ